MGAEVSSSLKDYSFEEEKSFGIKDQAICHAIKKDGQVFTAFCWKRFTGKEENECAFNAIQYLKVLRHPGIVKYLDCIRSSKKIYLLTEKVIPVSKKLKSLNLLEVTAGIHDIIAAVAFLHDKCKRSHNNICIDSVFITEEGKWKLAEMQHLCSFDNLKSNVVEQLKQRKDNIAPCPEDKNGSLNSVSYGGHERDSYAVALLVKQLLEENFQNEPVDVLMNSLTPFLDVDPSSRPAVKNLLQIELFQNEYLDVRNFLEKLTMKSHEDRKKFFRSITSKLFMIPEYIVAAKLSSLLFSRLVLLDNSAREYLLPHIFLPCEERKEQFVEGEINPLFTISNFEKYILPKLYKILYIKDVAIRLVLLDYFSQYIEYIPKSSLQHDVLPEILLGLKDTNNVLVAATLRALADMVPILGGSVIVGSNQTKLFADVLPKQISSINCIKESKMESPVPINSSSQEIISNDLETENRSHITKKDKSNELKLNDRKLSMDNSVEPVEDAESTSVGIPNFLKREPVLLQNDWTKFDGIPERSSPDGGEDLKPEIPICTADNVNSEWSDWDSIESDDEKCTSTNKASKDPSLIEDSERVNDDLKEDTLLSLSKKEQPVQEIESNKTKQFNSKRAPLKLISPKKEPIANASAPQQNNSVVNASAQENNIRTKTLGEEYDIFASFTNVHKDYEYNLFEDMQPEIAKSTKSAPVVLNEKPTGSGLFEVKSESNAQVESGWDDDLDWGSF